MADVVRLAESVVRGLVKLPKQVQAKLIDWSETVELFGLAWVRKIPGYHDEPLGGARKGQRSIRLNKGWRAFYVIDETGEVRVVLVIDVNKHKY
jgi:toxin HigB-1